MHVAWPTGTGFRLLEVWISKEARERADREVVAQVWAALAAGAGAPSGDLPHQRITELETRGLVIPPAGLAV